MNKPRHEEIEWGMCHRITKGINISEIPIVNREQVGMYYVFMNSEVVGIGLTDLLKTGKQ